MSVLQFTFDWLDPGEMRGEELRATFAEFGIFVHGAAVTQLHDHVARSVRDRLSIPLYPVAEWFVDNWWVLHHESESPLRKDTVEYQRRHALHTLGEGYPVPAFVMSARGESIALRWSPLGLPWARIDFIGAGAIDVPRPDFTIAVTGLIEAVVRRLEQSGVRDTFLQQEWAQIIGAPADETEFCEVSGALGLDPYTLEPDDRRRIVDGTPELPPLLREEFLAVADLDSLQAKGVALIHALSGARKNTADLRVLRELRQAIGTRAAGGTRPWREGHARARHLREVLHLNGAPLPSIAHISKALGLAEGELEQAIIPTSAIALLDGTVGMNERGSPGFALIQRSEPAVRFALARALHDYLLAPGSGETVLTSSQSDRQMLNRAFAAEFLAPASGIRSALPGPIVGQDEIDVIAERFGVSNTVIEHQIGNHGLAVISP